MILALAGVSDAAALEQRPPSETFGSAQQPNFELASGIAIDQATGDVLIADQDTESIRRFHADGTPAPFKALGTNVIDGLESGSKPCAEEPASCDVTPQPGIQVPQGVSDGSGRRSRFQIAVDESDAPTAGDIYLTQRDASLVDIFASDGRYLGQLTEAGDRPFIDGVLGVAVDPGGTLFVANGDEQISKFAATESPPNNADFTGDIPVPESGTPYDLAFGRGPTAGSLFLGYSYEKSFPKLDAQGYGEGLLQLDPTTGRQISEEFDTNAKPGPVFGGWITVNPSNGNVVDGNGSEFEIRGEGEAPVRVSRILPAEETFAGVAINEENEVIFPQGSTAPTAVQLYGPPATVPVVSIDPVRESGGSTAAVSGTVNPLGLPLTGKKCAFEYGRVIDPRLDEVAYGEAEEVPCEGAVPADSGPHRVQATLQGLEPGGVEYGVRLVAFDENGQEETESVIFKTAPTVATEPPSPVGLTSATLRGVLRPEGSAFTDCFFQYGLASSRIYEQTVSCSPEPGKIPGDFKPHGVAATISGLQGGSTYRFRVVATNGEFGTVDGDELSFETLGLPVVSGLRASGADQSSVTLEATVDPAGFATSYSFEWGPSADYGNRTTVTSVGAGTDGIPVKAPITGLAGGSVYHFRVVASSPRGTVETPDQIAETLDSCGLPEGRCFELVSRSEAGPVGVPGEARARGEQLTFQAATAGPGLAYPVESGYPEATKGAASVYRARRGPKGWLSTQLSPPITALNEQKDDNSFSSTNKFVSDDLRCGVTESIQPLTDDPGMRLAREEGGSNLYRINPEGASTAFTGITTLPPTQFGPLASSYKVGGASQDCSVVVFRTPDVYAAVPITQAGGRGGLGLYEWRAGNLRQVGMVPGPFGEVGAAAVAGGEVDQNHVDTANSVSEDGSRVFFSAPRATSTNPEEKSKTGVFVRENGTVTRDLSLSQTATPDTGALYQWATADGSKVFFTADAGLTIESNTAGIDLYEYDLETDELTDRTVTDAEGGAEVRGFLGASADGSQVYFASRNQLVPGRGNSRAQNMKSERFSLYGERAGALTFVGRISDRDVRRVLIEESSNWNSQVSPDGRYLLFESSGEGSDGLNEVFLYDREGPEVGAICISCRQDGLPSPDERYGAPGYEPIKRDGVIVDALHPAQFLVERDGEPQAFFSSPDQLAPGATAGQNNIYEWSHGQLFRLASAPEGTELRVESGIGVTFGGASKDGSDVYVATSETLSWQDADKRLSIYDARIGGGYPEPPPFAEPCKPSQEGSCLAAPPVVARQQAPESSTQISELKRKKSKRRKHTRGHHHRKAGRKKKNKSAAKISKAQKMLRANRDQRNGK